MIEPDNDLKEEEVMEALKDCGYQPEQLEFDFSDGSTASSQEIQCPFCRRIVSNPFEYYFCNRECFQAYNKKWGIKYTFCKTVLRIILMPFALVYHIGLGIFCIFALPILLIGIVLRGLFRTFL